MRFGINVYLMIPFMVFLGLIYILWDGLSLNPVYTLSQEVELVQSVSHTEYIFNTPIQAQQFRKLLKNFRCTTCQNQSLADSTAPLALSMRESIYTKLKAGQTEKEIQDFLVLRYGDFVVYNPPFKKETLVLWLGPCLFFLIGIAFAVRRSIG